MKNLTNLLIKGAMAYALAMHGANAAAQQVALAAEQAPVTAIDILLEPDATMLQHSEANNARLLKVYPKGFALDAAHRPHITMVQCYVRTADLDQVYDAAGYADYIYAYEPNPLLQGADAEWARRATLAA